ILDLAKTELQEYVKTCTKSELEKQLNTRLEKAENASLNSLLCAHDMLILPSLKEPWGLVVEEALSAGLPVLVSLACGAQVLVQEGVNGFLFCPKDSARL
uniref:glycosyltransferase n=1 Tax=Helicobacter suis TaxID=104628 RepID=UPI001F086A06